MKYIVVLIIVLLQSDNSFSQAQDDTHDIAVHHHYIEISKTVYLVTQFTDESGRIWFRKGFKETDGDEGDGIIDFTRYGRPSRITYKPLIPPVDTISTFGGFQNVNPDSLENVFFAEVFYSIIGEIFLRTTGNALFDENTIIAALEYKDYQSEPIEFEFFFMNLPVVEGTNTLYYCHFVSSDIDGLRIGRFDSTMVKKKKLRRLERELDEHRETSEILHCVQFRKPDLLFVDGIRYYIVPECLAYGEPKPDSEERKKFSEIHGPMFQLYSNGHFSKKPNFFPWVKSLFR